MAGGDGFWHPLGPGGGASALDDLSDVDVTTAPPADGQALVYDAGSGLWAPGTVSGGSGGGAKTIDTADGFAEVYGADSLGLDQEFNAAGSTSPPVDWSWVNQGASSYLEGAGAAAITIPNAAQSVRGIVRAVPGATTWTAYAKVTAPLRTSNYAQHGVFLCDGGVKASIYGWFSQGIVDGNHWSNVGGGTLTVFGTGFTSDTPRGDPVYWRIRKNSATSWDFAWSTNGRVWRQNGTAVNISTHQTPTHVGFFANTQSIGEFGATCDWFRFR